MRKIRPMFQPLRSVLAGLTATLIGSAAMAQEIRLEDMAGREIVLPKPAERVVSLPIPIPPVIAATVGSPDSIVAMHPRALNSVRIGLILKMFPQMRSIPTDIIRGSGFEPNVEEILKYRPDVVFQWANEPLDVLDNAGLKAVALDTGHAEKLEKLLSLSAEAHGKSAKAKEIVRRHVEIRQKLAAVAAGIPAEQRPRILYFYRYHMGGEWQTRGGTIQSEYRNWYMDIVGARNVAAGGAATISFTPEQALAWNPDIIILNAYEKADVTGKDLVPADVYADPFLSQTPAAKNHRVYKTPVGALWWDSGNQESPLFWQWLAMLTQPDKYSFDLRGQLVEWFKFLYGYDLSQDEIDEILHVKDHADAAGYERFRRP